ncbi:MAG: N-acetylmuramoyl-L-alanine amidase (endogenous virus) [Lactobacillus phage ViSo-2018b]|nr:MAG: N-acetylmuramoyl-L-alanine amidase [Lactobacillus phage ViSo-2018b]
MADGVVTIDSKFPANEPGFKSDVAQVEEILKRLDRTLAIKRRLTSTEKLSS